MRGDRPRVVVIGGVYVDMAVRCVDFPATGQTVSGSGFSYIPAGAGLSQAAQAALCGCEVFLAGKVGKDDFAKIIRNNLDSFGINHEFLFEADAKNTGTIVSFVSSSGANRTIISEGANRALADGDIKTDEFEKLLGSADVCLINGGLSRDFVCAAIRAAKLARAKVVLDPAASSELPQDYYTADIITLNFAEAAESAAAANHNIHTAKIIGTDFIARGAGCAIIKLGKRGAVVVNRENATHIPAFDVQCVDRTGCGDAFDGALAASLAVGDEIIKAAKFASAAGAIACTKFGAIESLPKKMEIIQLLQTLPE